MTGRVLIVDDQPQMCKILSRILSDAGYPVQTALSGGEALSVVATHKVAVILLDYRLPDMNGLELLELIRQRNSRIPAILMTSYGSKELKKQALKAGCAVYFDKPLSPSLLVETLQKLLTASR